MQKLYCKILLCLLTIVYDVGSLLTALFTLFLWPNGEVNFGCEDSWDLNRILHLVISIVLVAVFTFAFLAIQNERTRLLVTYGAIATLLFVLMVVTDVLHLFVKNVPVTDSSTIFLFSTTLGFALVAILAFNLKAIIINEQSDLVFNPERVKLEI